MYGCVLPELYGSAVAYMQADYLYSEPNSGFTAGNVCMVIAILSINYWNAQYFMESVLASNYSQGIYMSKNSMINDAIPSSSSSLLSSSLHFRFHLLKNERFVSHVLNILLIY